jgi:hypothetical protein
MGMIIVQDSLIYKGKFWDWIKFQSFFILGEVHKFI